MCLRYGRELKIEKRKMKKNFKVYKNLDNYNYYYHLYFFFFLLDNRYKNLQRNKSWKINKNIQESLLSDFSQEVRLLGGSVRLLGG